MEAGAGSGGAAVSKSCRFFKWSTALVDDVEKTYRQMSEKGVEFVAPPKKEAGAPRRSSKTRRQLIRARKVVSRVFG